MGRNPSPPHTLQTEPNKTKPKTKRLLLSTWIYYNHVKGSLIAPLLCKTNISDLISHNFKLLRLQANL